MATLSNFGEQFAAKTLEKMYQNDVFNGIVNRDYEGEIKKPGDRVNILSFLNSILLTDYTVGSDMASETIVDTEDQLVVEKRKYYNFALDRLEDVFTYATDIPARLIADSAAVLGRAVDEYVFNKFGQEAKAGNWIGLDLKVTGSGQTEASITTTATGGTITVNANSNTYESQIGTSEDTIDGVQVFAGFQTVDLFKGIRLRSSATFVSPWYRISAITSSTVASITEWDEAVAGSDFEEGYTLRGLFGGNGNFFTKYGSGDQPLINMSALGWEFQAARGTSVTALSIYDQATLLAQALDDNEVPAEGRKLSGPPALMTMLRQAAETQPTGIADMYTGTVTNGRVMRFGGFDIHSAAGSRISTRAGKSTAATGGPSADTTMTTGVQNYIIPANHLGFMTYADKWSESRVVDAENQFAKKYQGLYLFGAKVPVYRRKAGAILFGSF